MKHFKGDSTDVDSHVQGLSEEEIEEALDEARKSASRTDMSEDERIEALHDLAILLSGLWCKYGTSGALEEAIDVMQKVVKATPKRHPQRLERLFLLEDRTTDKFSETKALTLLDDSINLKREIVELAQDDEDLMVWLNYLASSLEQRYRNTGAIRDFDEAIEIARKIYDMNPEGPLTDDQIGWGSNLSHHLMLRYRRLGAENDLDEAIVVSQTLLKNDFPPDSLIHSEVLQHAAILLLDRYARKKTLIDLNEAIAKSKKALDVRPKLLAFDDGSYLTTLSMALYSKYLSSISQGATDLDEAITLGYVAITKTPDSHEENPVIFSSQSERLHARYDIDGNVEDLDSSIELAAAAVDRCVPGSPHFAGYLEELALGYFARYNRLESHSDLDDALLHSSHALEHPLSITSDRVRGGVIALNICERKEDWDRAYEVSTLMISLAPKLTPQSLRSSDKQHAVGQSLGLVRVASRAAAAALNAGKGPSIALTLLEQGRGLFTTSVEELRTDVIDLQRKHPELAKRFTALQAQLDTPALATGGIGEINSEAETLADWRFDASKQFEALTEEIRKLPGFEDLFLAPKEDKMLAAASKGPIAVINVTDHRCDALVVETKGIHCIELPNLRMRDIEQRAAQADLGSPEALEWLWDVVAQPVLHGLGFDGTLSEGTWPRMWWIPTSLLCRFPLHAAGYHASRSSVSVLDRVISSYNSSIKTLIQGRRSNKPSSREPKRALLVSMPTTPEHSRLLHADREIASLTPVCKEIAHPPMEPGHTKQEIVSRLPLCNIFHFAGHGYTGADPSQSSLLLKDWKSDLFTVLSLFDLNLRSRSPFLAYLSACGTGEVLNERFYDESIHLISAFLLAGFRHVIGTLWEVNDEICVDMAYKTYTGMKDGNMSDEAVCFGLHQATVELRNRWLEKQPGVTDDMDDLVDRSGRKWVVDDSDDDGNRTGTPPLWAPYVHFGV